MAETPATPQAIPETPRPPYGTVAVVGVGLIGGSLALALRHAGFAGRLVGVSSSATLREAHQLGVIDEGLPYERLDDAARDADLLVLAGPISVIVEQLQRVARLGSDLPTGLVVTDVGSTKRAILRAAAKLPSHVHFVGGHPLAGSEQRGVGAAEPFLFQNAYYVLTPAAATPESVTRALGDFLGTTGARMLVLDAEVHDRVAAAISHVPQLLAVSLVRYLDRLGENRTHATHLAAGGFRDMTRIASSPYSVWHDIVETNRDVIADLLGDFLRATEDLFGGLESARIEAAFDRAAHTRSEIPRDTKGFLHRLWDVLVVVEDRPGVLVGVCGPLADEGINVMDIEVVKVREGEGGTLRLAFNTHDEAGAAVRKLRELGWKARLRE